MSRRTLALYVAAGWLAVSDPGVANAGLCGDTDCDGIPDVLDKCSYDSRNATVPASCDSDVDGYGNVCDGDFDQNFSVNALDFTMLFLPRFRAGVDVSPVGADMDCNGTVNSLDFTKFFVPKFKGALGGAVPGPSGLSCAGTPGCQ